MQKTIFTSIKGFLTAKGLDMKSADIRYAFVLYYVFMETFNDYMGIRKIADYIIEQNELKCTQSAFTRSYMRTKKKLENLGVGSDVYELALEFAQTWR